MDISISKQCSAYDIETVCGRTVEKNKYEANAPETRNWWNQLFGKLEFDAAIPVEKRLEVLEQVFPNRIVDRIVSILGVEDKKYKEPLEKIKDDVGEALRKRVGSLSSLLPDSEKSICDDTDIKECAAAVMTASSSTTTVGIFGATEEKKNESLHEFFKRRPGREAIWRPLPPLSLEEMNLNQKAAYITEAIARDFVEWIKTLGGDEESYLTVQGVVEMFEIGYPVNAATSLRVELKQMPSVPQQVADSTMVPEVSRLTI
ncbi:hypothetical protein NQ317_012518 [Molorchus minor]|uniref:Uncharacterized protein n=1 Tax=Molorchus minor TaxID=1323400 RepID=A0ABQ9K1F4_9CUCU|nr:hypothetical protein NQ317_012518 [Molorchus minor]